jgi:predicted DNA-binding protein
MPRKEQGSSQVVSVRLPDELIRRLDRYLDWSDHGRRGKSSRNAAVREALNTWLAEQEQLAGFLHPQTLHQQFHAAYQSVRQGDDGVPIHRLRHLLPWPRERFDAVLEGLRADHHVELERAGPGELSDQEAQESYHVHGQLYGRLQWCA